MSESRDIGKEREIIRKLIHDFQVDGWENAWKADVVPWDVSGDVQPPLRSLLLGDEEKWPREGRALVAGCGRGYDPIFIASTLGLDTVAIDISQTAIEAAQSLLSKTSDQLIGKKITFLQADFFSLSVPNEKRFDLAYDYTFFVAIPPARRPEWGEQMNSLIKPGGYLILLVYPLTATEEGPPFYVRPEHYYEVLGDGWTTVISRTPEDSLPSHIGCEYLLVLKKK